MAFCIRCGHELPKEANFCGNCGTPVSDTSSNSQRKTTYDGEIHKCPNCGEILNSFTLNCPACGYELRSMSTNSPVNELARKIEKTSSLDEKIELIANFYVPNTREDIYDFFILAVSNLENTSFETDDAWRSKLEQTYHKAKIAFGKTPEFDYIEKLYNKTHSKVAKRRFSTFVRKNKMICISALSVGVGLLLFASGIILLIGGDNEAAPLLIILSIIFIIISLSMISEFMEAEKKKVRRKKDSSKAKNNVQSIGKDADEFIHEHFENVTEQLRILGFKNIVTKAEKKGLLAIEGAVKDISIAGNSEFTADDVFDLNAKIIIWYYSKNS